MLTVAYIAPAGPQKVQRTRKPTAAELLHQEALATVAARRIQDRAKAKMMFKPERDKLEALRVRRDELRKQMC